MIFHLDESTFVLSVNDDEFELKLVILIGNLNCLQINFYSASKSYHGFYQKVPIWLT